MKIVSSLLFFVSSLLFFVPKFQSSKVPRFPEPGTRHLSFLINAQPYQFYAGFAGLEDIEAERLNQDGFSL